jgi:hypothetical protein
MEYGFHGISMEYGFLWDSMDLFFPTRKKCPTTALAKNK